LNYLETAQLVMMRIGTTEIILLVLLALLIFGGSRLAGLGKALGTSIRDFRKETRGGDTPAADADADADKDKEVTTEATANKDEKPAEGATTNA
jgi:sec-independent protein translocase protein TatA